MNVQKLFDMKKGLTFQDYYCTVTISYHHHSPRKPTLIQALHGAAFMLLCCLANRSLDTGFDKNKVDYTCFKYKDPEPV